MTTARRVLRLESLAHRLSASPAGLTMDEKLGILAECRYIEYRGRCIVVVDDAPSEVRAWLSQNAPDGYSVA